MVAGEDYAWMNTGTNKTGMHVNVWTNVFIDRQSTALKDGQEQRKEEERCSERQALGGGAVHKRAYRVFFNGCYHRASSKMMKRRTVYGLLRNHLSSCVCLLSSLFWINLTVLAAAESPLYIRDNIWNSKCLILHIGRPKQASHSYWATDLWHLCL